MVNTLLNLQPCWKITIYKICSMRSWYWFLITILFLTACGDSDDSSPECLPNLSVCNSEGRFCTFGSKWGEDRIFSPAGNNTPGPGTTGGVVTYSFQDEGIELNFNDEMIISRDFDVHQIGCGKDMIREAFAAYSAVANIDFSEEPSSPNSDIRIFAGIVEGSSRNGDITAFGIPPRAGSCVASSGTMLFDSQTGSCHEFFLLALHEIGHALGLGHPGEGNIMSPGPPDLTFTGLRAGDIEGIRSIYGPRE